MFDAPQRPSAAPPSPLRFAAVQPGLTRRRFLRATLGLAGAFGTFANVALARDTRSPRALALAVRGAALRFKGDRPMYVTIAPGVPGRDVATVLFSLDRKALVQVDAVRMGIRTADVAWSRQATLRPGAHEVTWRPAPDTPVGSYVMRRTLSKDGRRRV